MSRNSFESTASQDIEPPPTLESLSCISTLADRITPVQAFEIVRNGSPAAFLLESSEADSRLARYSIIGFDPLEIISFRQEQAQICSKRSSFRPCLIQTKAPLELLERRLAQVRKAFDATTLNLPFPVPFLCAYVGYLGYGATSYFDGIVQQEKPALGVPDGIFAFYDCLLVFDHRERQLHIVSFRSDKRCREILSLLEGQSAQTKLFQLSDPGKEAAFSGVEANMSKEDFIASVEKCRQYIKEGQVFQIVLSQRFRRSYRGEPYNLYRVLQSINPSPYAYYLQFPDFVYLGASPESLLCCRDSRLSLTALAGTRARGENAAEEALLEAELLSSEKELAEHYMLVDLGRNDLGRVAEIGTVEHGPIAQVIRYGQVMHLSTEIRAKLAAGLTCFDALRSCFPAGTVSGAPKIRAMELLSEIEPEKRGIYSGMVGYFDIMGNMDSAIAIRSALVKNGELDVNAGAGIVMDSIAEDEYEETRNKALSVLKAAVIAEKF